MQNVKIDDINDLWYVQKEIWRQENENYFGITPLSNWQNEKVVKEHLKDCTDRLWNGGTNQLKQLFEQGKCKDIEKMVPNSWELVYDQSGIICLYATFQWEQEKENGEREKVEKRAPLAYLPVPDDMCWFLGESKYVLRITATANYSLIYRIGNVCYYQKAWTYNLQTKKFKINLEDFDPWEKLTDMNREWLARWQGVEPENLTKEGFLESLGKLPERDASAVYMFRFTHVDEMFQLVARSKRFANPTMKVAIPINIVKMFTAQRVRNDAMDRKGSNNLVLAQNELFALENSRTVIYKNEFNRSFMFSNTDCFFDAFKTSTNKSAGKSRLILDHVVVKDGKLWNSIDGELMDMWQIAAKGNIKLNKNLSVLSSSNFGGNNAPKRIMMTAKLRAQALPTVGESDPFTHETPARIVFGDWKGFNFGDSIIISRSFARKLRSKKSRKIRIDDMETWKYLSDKYKIGDKMSVEDFTSLIDSTMCNNYRNITIQSFTNDWIIVEADVPFSVGDKLTNLHGSKGIVSLILEDEDMPFLKEPIGNFPAGPFEVIVSGLSVYRRKSLGQLFEAWSKARGHTDVDNIIDAVERYSDDMKEFSKQSVVFFGEESSVKPLGINAIIRLDHDAVGKQSHSYIKSNYARMLKFGEMELLNLAARGLFNIMNEIDVRSISKHHNALAQIRKMQRTGQIEPEQANALRFFNILRAIGFDFNLRNQYNMHINNEWDVFQRLLTDEHIDLF